MNDFIFKVYTFKHFIEDEKTQLQFIYEYMITKQAAE